VQSHFPINAKGLRELLPPAREDMTMARINRLLRSAPSRIGKRIAQFVAIAAASLPDAGA
jgi:hypothetical protein